MPEAPHPVDVSEATFEAEVLERSHTVPVVVDFWAAWCGPCRVLGPVLEREVAKLGGKVEMAKVDTDRNPGLSQRFGVRGIPAVKAFRDGKVVDEFVGAVPAVQVAAFLEKLAPPVGKLALAAAVAAHRAGALAEAERLLVPLAGDASVKDAAALELARVLLDAGRPGEVEKILATIDPRAPEAENAESVAGLAAFAASAAAATPADASSPEAGFARAAAHAAKGAWEPALGELLEIVARHKRFRDGEAHRVMLAIFQHLGDSDLAREYRKKLQIVT